MKRNFKELLHGVKCFVLDVDGVLTDGSVIVMKGELVRTMNIRDGYAIHEAVKAGYIVAVISGGKSENVKERLKNLGVVEIHMHVESKLDKLKELMSEHDLEEKNILYMGDDIPDREAMLACGIPTCPRDAASEIREAAIYISDKDGGKGCVRDVIEQTMRLHGKWKLSDDNSSSL